ncbi:hypothetical protein MMC21_001787 [Puttea exsequens]|nr:hypothetical protein [Puttea exsequens]
MENPTSKSLGTKSENKTRWLPLTSPPISPAMNPAVASIPSALAEVPALPLSQKLPVAASTTSISELPQSLKFEMLTPPHTPEKKRASTSAGGIDGVQAIGLGIKEIGCGLPKPASDREKDLRPLKEVPTEPRSYKKGYQLQEQLGYGVWSNVYRASETTATLLPLANLPPSPPTSPLELAPMTRAAVLAVKKPSRRDAHKVLEKEARILTYLHSQLEASAFLVPFHGFDAATYSIILTAVSLSLESHAMTAAKEPLSTKTMYNPVIGATDWAHLAESLIDGLAFLHGKGCVHGDIKPANILIRADADGQLTPLYCDFSSSHVIATTSSSASHEIEEVSAVTPDYTSPELLESLYLRKTSRAVATTASDVFTLAVTLLFAAIGESPYATARMDMQKLAMAKEGLPLEFARRGEQASRVMKGSVVAKALEHGLAKDINERLDVQAWRVEMKGILEGRKTGGLATG